MDIVKRHTLYNKMLFQRYAPIYDLIEIMMNRVRRDVVEKSNLPKGAMVLDVACGTGSQAVEFAKKGISVTGIDISEEMFSKARKKGEKFGIKFILHDALHIPYKDSCFDLSTISLAIHDMPERIAVTILKEMKRVTKRNGKIIIVDYRRPKNKFASWIGHSIANTWESSYYNTFLESGLESYLNKTGLKPVETSYYFLGNLQAVRCNNRK